MRIEKQLALFLDNRPGALARTCQALAKAKINVMALSILDSVDHAVVRMVVDQADKASTLLSDMGITVHQRDVLVMEIPNHPGELARLAERLAEAGINLEYAYLTGTPPDGSGILILRTNDLESTINALS